MSDYSNYGTTFYTMTSSGSGGSATIVAGVTNIDPPSITMPMVTTTNHSSGSFMTQIASGVVEIDDFTATLSYSGSTVSALFDAVVTGTELHYKILFKNNEACYFSAVPSGWQALGADSQSPEMSQVELTFSPSGTVIVT